MNNICPTCFKLFTSRSDISTTPCGHVFHTHCIEEELETGQNYCSQCKKPCTLAQIIKLYFSLSESENNLLNKLEEENLKLKEDFLRSEGEKLKSQEENLALLKHIDDLNSNWNTIKKALQDDCKDFKNRAIEAENRVFQGITFPWEAPKVR